MQWEESNWYEMKWLGAIGCCCQQRRMDCSHLVAQDRDCICSFSKSSSFHVFITSVTLFINCSDKRCLHRWKTCFFFFIGIYTGNMQSWSVPRLAEGFDVSTDVIQRVLESKFVCVRVHKGLRVYYFKMVHCGDLTNKGWSHSGHIALVDILFFP